MCGTILRISCMEIFAILIIIVTTTLRPVKADVIGYDCENKIENIKTISHIDIDECEIEDDYVETTQQKIALLNLNDYKHTTIIQCKVEIHRIVSYCGKNSYNSFVNGGLGDYTYPMTRETCEAAHKSGTVKIGNVIIDGLSVNNGTINKEITLAGTVDSTGSCNGAYYSDPYGSWENVIATGTAEITLQTESVKTKVESDKISLPSKNQCKLSEGNCIDSEGGYTFWNALPRTDCRVGTYSTLYRGKAIKSESEHETMYSVNVKDTSFTLNIVGTEDSCGVTILKTEHPKLFIVDRVDYERLLNNDIVTIKNDDSEIYRYIDTKFMYVEKFIQSQIKSIYKDVMKKKCKLEKKILKNTLSIAATDPDQFAFRYMGELGHMAVMAGEAIHIVQCLPVVVKIRRVDKCYNRLPIKRGNQDLFLTPLTHVITKYATELSCDSPLREHYRLEGTWYRFMPKPTDVLSPQTLQPKVKMNMTYQNPVYLAYTGIYTVEELHEMRERIMLPMDQNAITQNMAEQLTHGDKGSPSVENVFKDDLLEKLADITWSKSWGRFIWVGPACAGLISIFICVYMINTIIEACINGYTLYSNYGWSIHILAALWDSLAITLIFRGNNKGNRIGSTKSGGKPKGNKKPVVERRAPDLKKGVANSTDRPLKVPMPPPPRNNQLSMCIDELKSTTSNNKLKFNKKPDVEKISPDLKKEVPNITDCPLKKSMPPPRPTNPFSMCINELKSNKPNKTLEFDKKPDIERKAPDLKKEISNNSDRPLKKPMPFPRPTNPFSICISELEGRIGKN